MQPWDWRETIRDGEGTIRQWEAWTARGNRAVIARFDGYEWTVAYDPSDDGGEGYAEASGGCATLDEAKAACAEADGRLPQAGVAGCGGGNGPPTGSGARLNKGR